MTDNFLDTLRAYCREVTYPRTKGDILIHLEDEFHELMDEVWPKDNSFYYDDLGDLQPIRTPSEDGVFGESIDVIACAFDIIFKERPDATNEEILAYMVKKLEKWKTKYNGSAT